MRGQKGESGIQGPRGYPGADGVPVSTFSKIMSLALWFYKKRQAEGNLLLQY